MNLTTETAIFGSFLGTLILSAAMLIISRSPGAPRILWAFSAILALHGMQWIVQPIAESDIGLTHWIGQLVGTAAHAGIAVILLAVTFRNKSKMPAYRTLGAIWAVSVTALMATSLMIGYGTTDQAVGILVGLVMLGAGFSFGRRARKFRGAGYGVVALLIALWGVEKIMVALPQWDHMFGDLKLVLPQLFATAAGVALLVAADREKNSSEAADRAKAQALLQLQSEAMSAAASGIFITDHLGMIEWCNDAFCRLSGWSRAEIINQDARMLLMGVERPRDMEESLRQGRSWTGELVLWRKDQTTYTVEQTITPIETNGKIGHWVIVQEDVTERRSQEERIRYLSSHDGLTGLPNRDLFTRQMQKTIAQARAMDEGLAVLFLDLDDLSHYNDVLGHAGGDLVIQRLANRMEQVARSAAVIGRVGGDEFGFVVPDHLSGVNGIALAKELLAAISAPMDWDGQEIILGASIGIAFFPAHGDDAETLMKNADIAMYRAIQENPNGYRLYASAMDDELSERRKMEADLRRAAHRGELLLHYQPIVRISDRTIVGLEALVRWMHPVSGMIPPNRFIPLAEENGLIAPIGEWVLQEASRQAVIWEEKGYGHIPIAVNLSAEQMKRQDVPKLVQEILKQANLPPGRIELELTETAMMDDPETAAYILHQVKALGVDLAVDDFGTGYSSLGRLKRFPVCKLKIDRSFVSDLAKNESDRAIARAIISLAHALDMKVVAEGVETEEQLEILRIEGCDNVQGWLFAPALPPNRLEPLLAKGYFEMAEELV